MGSRVKAFGRTTPQVFHSISPPRHNASTSLMADGSSHCAIEHLLQQQIHGSSPRSVSPTEQRYSTFRRELPAELRRCHALPLFLEARKFVFTDNLPTTNVANSSNTTSRLKIRDVWRTKKSLRWTFSMSREFTDSR